MALPAGYRQLTSITSTGSQYIQTGIVPNSTTTVEMDFNTGPYTANTTFFGQGWGVSQYLFVKQSDAYKFYGGGAGGNSMGGGGGAGGVLEVSEVALDAGDYTVTVGALINSGTRWNDYLGYGALSATDRAGNVRPNGKHLDIGCYESPVKPGTVIAVR